MKSAGRIGILLLALVSVLNAQHPWPMFRANSRHTGRTDNLGPERPVARWSYPIGKTVISSPAIADDGTVYIGGYDSRLYAFAEDGTLKWTYRTGGIINSSPAIGSDGTVYFGSFDSYVYALAPDSTLSWRFAASDQVAGSPTIDADGLIYVAAGAQLYCLDRKGKPRWTFSPGKQMEAAPCVDDAGYSYIGSYYPEPNYLFALNPGGGSMWAYRTGGGSSSPALGPTGTVYVGSADFNLYALRNNICNWRFLTGYKIDPASPGLAADGTIYVGSADSVFYALDTLGDPRWYFRTRGAIVGSPAIDGAGTIYIGSTDSTLYALYPNGDLKWAFNAAGPIEASPAIGRDTTIAFATSNGRVYLLEEEIIVPGIEERPATAPAEVRARPNPFRSEALIAAPRTVEVRIYDATGTLVAALPGSGTLRRWSGRTAAGALCPPGIYFVATGATGALKLVRVP